jgi:hypothetical protein
MPVIGYFIVLNANVVELLQLHTPWVPNPERLSAGWRVFALFYGTMVLAAGSALFTWRCPEAVRKYPSPVEYVAAELSFWTPRAHLHHLMERLKAEREAMNSMQRALPELEAIGHFATQGGIPVSSDEELTRVLTVYWHALDTGQFITRSTIYVLFWVGSALVLIPSLWTAGQVAVTTWRYWTAL